LVIEIVTIDDHLNAVEAAGVECVDHHPQQVACRLRWHRVSLLGSTGGHPVLPTGASELFVS
jgi:hypothetical protein